MSEATADADLNFYFDPLCPFAWMTSKWVRLVASARDYQVDWRFISLRIVNEGVDYDALFPPEYEAAHTSGLKLLRVAARIRAEHGRPMVGAYYQAVGTALWDTAQAWSDPASPDRVLPVLEQLSLPEDLVEALDDESWDAEIRTESDEALSLTGKDVGTPILHFQPPGGVAFFGPVISRMPTQAEAVELWEHVIGLASFPGFAELKRSLRELPQLRALGVTEEEVGVQEDWHGGSRRRRK